MFKLSLCSRSLLLGAATVTLGGALVVGLAAAPVAASTDPHAESRIEVRTAATAWGAELTDPLFSSDVLWVPGDVRTAEFFVRNNGGSDAWLSIAGARGVDLGALPASSLSMRVRAGGTEWKVVPDNLEAVKIALASATKNQGVTTVELEVAFAGESGNDSQSHSARFALNVHLSEAFESLPVPGEPGSGGTGKSDPHSAEVVESSLLANSGGPAPVAAWWIAAAAVGTGSALLFGRLKDRREANGSLE